MRILPSLDEETKIYLGSAGHCVWLLGIPEYVSSTNDLLRRVVAVNSSVKPVVLAEFYRAKDVMLALGSGAWGFLCQDIPSNQLIKSLELIPFGQAVMFPQATFMEIAGQLKAIRGFEPRIPPNGDYKTSQELYPAELADLRSLTTVLEPAEQSAPSPRTTPVESLSRREFLILRTLTEGASNKIIARKLVITELTVKVHTKAILRKLKVHNRTQAALWARTHLGKRNENAAASTETAGAELVYPSFCRDP